MFPSRAMSKVQRLVTDRVFEKTKPDEEEEPRGKAKVRNSVLDQLLTTFQGRVISKEREEIWSETLKSGQNITCPCRVSQLFLYF